MHWMANQHHSYHGKFRLYEGCSQLVASKVFSTVVGLLAMPPITQRTRVSEICMIHFSDMLLVSTFLNTLMSLEAGLYLSKDLYTSQGQCMCIEHAQSVLHSYSSVIPSLLLFIVMLMLSLVVAFLRLHFSVHAVISNTQVYMQNIKMLIQ